MRALSGSILTLAGAVLSLTNRADYSLGYVLILMGLAVCAFGLFKPDR